MCVSTLSFWTDTFKKNNMLCFIFLKLYLACCSKEKRDVVSLYIALLSCAREEPECKIGLPCVYRVEK